MKGRFSLLLLLSVCTSFLSKAQDKLNLPEWKETPNELVVQAGKQNIIPDKYKVYFENTALLKSQLAALSTDYESGKYMDLPTPDGNMMTFRIWQTPMMEPALAAKYPDIKTFTAEAVSNHNITAKIDISPAGFHALVFNGEHTFFIDPYSDQDNGYFTCYFKKDYPKGNAPVCTVLDHPTNGWPATDVNNGTANKTHGTQRRMYRLALACTYEYSVAVGGTTPTKASVLAQMVLIMNRVNGVYERDLASTMTLVANTDTLIYLTSSDPYTNNDGNTMLGENISNVNTLIGLSNYDIGHVFSTGGGGVAYVGVLCNNTYKAGGVTGLPNPVGDAFAIDYVAHEMGHQFGSQHTFNSNLSACQGNSSATLAFEPGSGSTIMAYAGICSTDNLQLHSDAYFHAGSLKSIVALLTTSENTCASVTTTPNTPNTYPDFTNTYNIPNWTPFELTAPAVTDATADTLSYCWEEWDLGGAGLSWNANNDVMPFFRSFTPSFSPTRVFPAINNVMAGIYSYIGERLPYNARTLKFILTTRDIYQGYGAFNSSFDTDTITVNTSAIPGTTDTFKVTSQATTTTWSPGSSQTITWNAGTTASSPINASSVDIYLSIDSAQTFSYTLASNVPNNGSATVIIPVSLPVNSKTRVKVKGNNNVFFQLNKANISISAPLALTFSSFNADKNACGIDLHWTMANNDNAVSFDIERSNDGKTFQSIAQLSIQDSPDYVYKDENLKNGMYEYRIRITEKSGNTIFSDILSMNLNCNDKGNVMLFPNPSKDMLTVQASVNIHQLKVFSATGQLIETKKSMPNSRILLDIKDFADGVYLLQITTEDGVKQNLKFIKG